MKFVLFSACLSVAGFSAAGSALAQDANALRARSLAATCAQCHGTEGHAPPGSAMASLAGMKAAYLAEQMLAFKNGVRPGTVMPQLAKGFSDTQITQLAAYFAQQPASAARP